MFNFNKPTYIESNIWFSNDYLVQPKEVSKRCASCNRVKFTIEFIDYEDSAFVDGKIPVCLTCFRSNSPSKRLKMISALRVHGIQKRCLKCTQFRDLTDYNYNKKNFGLKSTCKHCARKRKEAEPIVIQPL